MLEKRVKYLATSAKHLRYNKKKCVETFAVGDRV